MARSSPESGQALLLTFPVCTSEGEGQALFLTMSVRSTTSCWLCSAGCSWTRSSWVIDCRDASAIPSVWVGVRFTHGCRTELLATPCCGCVEQSCLLELGCRRSGRHRGHLPSGSEWGSCTVGALRRHHGLWDVLRLAHGCRSVPHGTFFDTMRWVCWLFVGSPGWSAGGLDALGDTIRLGRCTPEVCWTFRAAKCFTCLRKA